MYHNHGNEYFGCIVAYIQHGYYQVMYLVSDSHMLRNPKEITGHIHSQVDDQCKFLPTTRYC